MSLKFGKTRRTMRLSQNYLVFTKKKVEWDIKKLGKITATKTDKLCCRFANHLIKLDVKNYHNRTKQVVVNEQKHNLPMLIEQNFRCYFHLFSERY